mgnify:CR=1 FL=1
MNISALGWRKKNPFLISAHFIRPQCKPKKNEQNTQTEQKKQICPLYNQSLRIN